MILDVGNSTSAKEWSLVKEMERNDNDKKSKRMKFGSNSKLAPTTGNNSLQPTSFSLMQEEHQQEPYFLRSKLLEAVDSEYNVTDMPLILEVLGKLEVLNVSKEILEQTRLGKTVNEFRRKVKDLLLARRLKDLVKKWREQVIPVAPKVNGTSSVGSEGGPATVPVPGGNRAIPQSLSSGYTSASSSPTLVMTSSRVSPAGSFNSNSLSPRIGSVTNYANNNNTSVHQSANRNGSSSIATRSPNYRNPQLLAASSYANQLVSPSASTASPFLNSRSLISPHKSRSPGGPTLTAFNSNNSNVSPFPSSQCQSSISSYAPNAETVSRTNAANKRYREPDDSPLSASVEPPSKKSRSAVNGTLDDPTLALDDISRDSYASRGSDHSDGFTSKDHRFSVSAPSPATPGQASVLSPQLPVPGTGTDSNVPSPTTPLETELANTSQLEAQSKRKRRKKKNEFQVDAETLLREKIAQAQAEKAAKAAREREMQLKEREAISTAPASEIRRSLFDDNLSEEKLANNVFVEKYLKSQNELREKMEREAVDALSGSDFQGAEEFNQNIEKLSKKEKKKLKKKLDAEDVRDSASTAHSFPSEAEILSQLPPIDPEILKEFENFKYDVDPSPPPSVHPSESGGGDAFNSYNKETESVNNLKSLSSTEEKPRKLIDWGDSEDEEELEQEKLRREREAEEDILTQQIQVISEYVTEDPTAELLANVALKSDEKVKDHFGDLIAAEATPVLREVDEEEVDRYIKDEIPNLNGNYDKDEQFKEWHETLTVESYKNEPLHILPYTIIDF